MEAARFNNFTYRDGVVYWITASKPPLPVLDVASFDPRDRPRKPQSYAALTQTSYSQQR
jgi:hypothetical protein